MAIYVDMPGYKSPVKVVSVKTAIETCGKSRTWMLRNISSGKVKAVKVEGQVWIPDDELQKLVKDKKESVTRFDPDKIRRKDRQASI